MRKYSLYSLFVFLAPIFAASIGYSQNGDFSLDGNVGSNSEGTSDSLDDSAGSGGDLFGDGTLADPPSDSKSTIVKPEAKAPAAPTVSKKAATLPQNGQIKGPASEQAPLPAGITQPAGPASASTLPAAMPPSAPASAAPASAPSVATSSVSTPPVAAIPVIAPKVKAPALESAAESLPEAPLAGDGSIAPVKSNSTHSVNEFGGVPPLPGTRRSMAAGEAPEFYDVEEGDTMFDVCSQLIDDGNYWPKLWSLNPDVKNPHFIFPGMKLAFYSGDLENPPFLEVVADDEVVPVEKGEIKEAELVAESIPKIGDEGGSVKVVRGIEEPSPVPVVGPSEIGAEGDALDGFIFSGRSYSSDDLSISVPAFYFAEEKQALGQVIGGYSGGSIVGDDGKALVASESSLAEGTYTVLRPVGLVNSPRTGEKVGYRYEFEGNIRLTRKTQGGLMQGDVFDTYGGVRAGDIVVNFLATRRTINSSSTVGTPGTANSSVIGFKESGKESGSKGDLVYLEKQGLSPGSYYVIFRTENNRVLRHQANPDARKDAGAAAVARIIEVSGEAALGYIVSGNSEVRVGDSLSLQ